MAKYTIPENVGRVRVAMTLGNKITVWNGKQGQDEFTIICKTKKKAQELCDQINRGRKRGDVWVD